MIYEIHALITSINQKSWSMPVFYLDGNTSGINTSRDAELVAKKIIGLPNCIVIIREIHPSNFGWNNSVHEL